MRKITILSALAFILVAGTAQAKHFGMAGCGLGSLVFKDDEMATQILAATTNGTSGNQTFGITSGTSNCTDDGVATAQGKVPLFIETNQLALANDIARGQGETLESLAAVLGCSDSARLGSTLQRNYDSIFSNENIRSSNVTGSILETVRGDSSLAGNCRELI